MTENRIEITAMTEHSATTVVMLRNNLLKMCVEIQVICSNLWLITLDRRGRNGFNSQSAHDIFESSFR